MMTDPYAATPTSVGFGAHRPFLRAGHAPKVGVEASVNGDQEPPVPLLDVDALIDRALDQPTQLEQLKALTRLVQQANELSVRSAPIRAKLIRWLVEEDDRSLSWISRKVGVAHQQLSKLLHRAQGDGA
jgi:hypothetical protein